MKKYLKVMLVLVVALSLLCTVVLADTENPFNFGGTATTGNAGTAINNIGATVVEIIKTLGYVLAVVMVLVTGIQWLIGTPAKKQELKGKLINVVIGAVLIVGATQLLGVLYSVTSNTASGLNRTEDPTPPAVSDVQ